MFNDWKIVLAVLAVLLGISGYARYIWGIFRRGVKPHAFSWLVWGTLTGVAFAIQFTQHAGPGSWSMGLGAVACLVIFGFALGKGNRQFSHLDWVCLGLAILAIALWAKTQQPLVAAILVTGADALGYIPTFRKGFKKPTEENLTPMTMGIIIPILSIPALENFALANWLYPASLIISNSTFVSMILLRRRKLSSSPPQALN